MRSKFFSSIRARMVLIYLLVTVVTLVMTSVVVSVIMEEFLVSQRTKTQTQETTRLALEIAPEFEEGDPAALYSLAYERAQTLGGRILLLDTDAVVQVDSASQANGYLLPYREVRDILVSGKEASYGFHHISMDGNAGSILSLGERTTWAVYYTAPITADGVYVGAVLFSSLIQDVENSVQEVLRQIAVVFTAVMFVIAAVSFILSGWLTKPIINLTNAIRRMGVRGYGVRVEVKGGGEIAELGKAFNRMSEQIEDHDRVRDEFIANASHELKTPLSTMKLLSESILLEKEPDPGLMREFFSDVDHEVDRLSRIVTDLLRIVQDEADNSAALKPEPVRLDTLTENTAARLAPLAEKKGIRLYVNAEPAVISAEPLRIEQVVVNLVENAIKYTDKGSVNVSVCEDRGEAVFAVRDSGIGIPEEAIPHLFERFYRVDKARSRGTGGTGLGLSIVSRIVAMHKGYIEVESKTGEGSTFTVRFPAYGQETV